MQVAVFAPLAGSFTYLWPEMLGKAEIGIRVLVPFGHTKKLGVVIGTSSTLGDSPALAGPRTALLSYPSGGSLEYGFGLGCA